MLGITFAQEPNAMFFVEIIVALAVREVSADFHKAFESVCYASIVTLFIVIKITVEHAALYELH